MDSSLAMTMEYDKCIAGIAAALVAWRTRNMMLTIGAGMAVLWGLQAVL